MTIHRLTDSLYIATQLNREDVREAASIGIRSVICNRPDGEADDQPDFAEVKQWLADAGIRHAAHQPVTAPSVNRNDAENFQALLAAAEAPVLAYCRTGTRCTLLWGMYQAQNGMPVADVMAAAQKVNVDLSSFETRLQDAARNG